MSTASVGASTTAPAVTSFPDATQMAADPGDSSQQPVAPPSSGNDPSLVPTAPARLPEFPALSVSQSLAAAKLRRASIKMVQILMESSPLGTPVPSDDEAEQKEKRDPVEPARNPIQSQDDEVVVGKFKEDSPLKAAMDGMRSPSPVEYPESDED